MGFYKCGGSVTENNYMLSGNENNYMFLGPGSVRYANAGTGSSSKVRKRYGESFIWIPKYANNNNIRIGTINVINNAPTANSERTRMAGFGYAIAFGYATLDNGKIKFNSSSSILLDHSKSFTVPSDAIFSYLTFSYIPNDDYESSDATNELFYEMDSSIDIYVA